jgi:plastocyanin
MKRLNGVVRFTICLATTFALVFSSHAGSGDKRLNTTQPKKTTGPGIRIVDQNGRQAVSGVPSGTGQIFDVAVGQGGDVFVPDTVNISVGDTVRWTWAESGHSVTSGPPCFVDSQFCSPDDTNCLAGVLSNIGTVYEHTFAEPGVYSYFCHAHCVIGMTGVVNVSGGCTPSGWSAGPDMPSPDVRSVGVFFLANGKFYAMGGRAFDGGGGEFTNPFEYDPVANSWTTKSAAYPDNQVNNMSCGVLNDAGTDYIYCVGGSESATSTTTGRVFRYDPVADVITTVAGGDWPPGANTTVPGGFAVFSNQLFTLGGFDILNGVGINQIWQFTPSPAGWVQKGATLPVPLGYIPATTIGSFIYTGGGSDITGGVLTDTTNSFKYDPVANSISTIAPIPRATGETRALNFNGLMYVMGGGRVAPNPSNEVDIYDPGTDTWSLGIPFSNGRRNFPTDTDGTTRIWLSGGYDVDGVTPLASLEIFCAAGATPSPTPTPTVTPSVTPTATPTVTPSVTPTVTPSITPTPTPSTTPPPTATPRVTPRPRPTPFPRPTP